MLEEVRTQRLLLRPWRAEDAQDLFAYAKSPRVGPAAGWTPHKDMEESRRIIEMFIRENDVWAMQRLDDGRVVGSIGLHRDRTRDAELPVRMLGYVLGERDWGQGLMHEGCVAALGYGFGQMGLSLISVWHVPENVRSRHVIEKLGFQLEGTRRMSEFYPGRVAVDTVCYSMTAQEYAALYSR